MYYYIYTYKYVYIYIYIYIHMCIYIYISILYTYIYIYISYMIIAYLFICHMHMFISRLLLVYAYYVSKWVPYCRWRGLSIKNSQLFGPGKTKKWECWIVPIEKWRLNFSKTPWDTVYEATIWSNYQIQHNSPAEMWNAQSIQFCCFKMQAAKYEFLWMGDPQNGWFRGTPSLGNLMM